MKTLCTILSTALLLGCSGCYTAQEYALQPREKIVFADEARANEFRTLSGNDAQHGGSVVQITRPTRVTCE